MTRLLVRSFAFVLAAVLAGCATSGYYTQAFSGQLDLWQRMESIDDLLARPGTEAPVKVKLGRVRAIREFASRELGLPDNGSYRKYADLKRPFVVWNVFATEEFSLRPREWCFLVVGCVSYRGYFSKTGVDAYAEELKSEGYDVFVGGVPAYSTLGYFDDPVLSTFINYPETELARLIFHELSHQLLYVPSDSAFNESFAATVELEGVRRWIETHGKQADKDLFAAAQTRRQDYLALVDQYRGKLNELYTLPQASADKRAGKRQLFEALQADYQRLKASWGGFAGYDWIFKQNLNNAFFVSNALYTQLVPAFQALLARSGGDLQRFYSESGALAGKSREAREASFAELLNSAGGKTAVAAPVH